MQILINIDEDVFTRLFDNGTEDYETVVGDLFAIAKSIRNGTSLPKGHGDLKDADAMINKLCTHEASELFGSITCAEIMDFINNEKPIIEADKGE